MNMKTYRIVWDTETGQPLCVARAGRPPVAGVARDKKVQIGFTPDEHASHVKAARDAGVSLNEWVRRACARAMV